MLSFKPQSITTWEQILEAHDWVTAAKNVGADRHDLICINEIENCIRRERDPGYPGFMIPTEVITAAVKADLVGALCDHDYQRAATVFDAVGFKVPPAIIELAEQRADMIVRTGRLYILPDFTRPEFTKKVG